MGKRNGLDRLYGETGKLALRTKKNGGNKMTDREIRNEYWEKALREIRCRVEEAFGGMKYHLGRNAFDGKTRKGLQLSCVADIRPAKISVGMYFKTRNQETNKALFEYMMRRRDEILSMLPFNDVTIGQASENGHQLGGDRKQYNITVSMKKDVLDRERWVECCNFHCTVARVLYEYVFVEKKQAIESLIS